MYRHLISIELTAVVIICTIFLLLPYIVVYNKVYKNETRQDFKLFTKGTIIFFLLENEICNIHQNNSLVDFILWNQIMLQDKNRNKLNGETFLYLYYVNYIISPSFPSLFGRVYVCVFKLILNSHFFTIQINCNTVFYIPYQ